MTKLDELRQQRLNCFRAYLDVALKARQLMSEDADIERIAENAGEALVCSADYIQALEEELKALYESAGEDARLSTKTADLGPMN